MIKDLLKKIIKNKVKIRTISFVLLSLLAYGFTIFYLFASHDIFGSIVCLFFLFVLFHFMSLDIKKFKSKYMILILLSLTIVVISILLLSNWGSNMWLIAAVVSLNSALLALFFSLKSIQFKSMFYFLRWWYIFTLFITTTYSVALMWMFQEFPLTCEGLQWASDKLIEFVETPFTFSVDTIDFIRGEWSEDILDIKVTDVLLKAKETEVIADSGSMWAPIMIQFNEWKSNSVDQIIWQQESYSLGMCDMLLDEINAKYNLQEFKLSAILLIYLLLFGFVRVAFLIMSLAWFIIFKLLYLLWLYKIIKIKKEVYEIK